ncbi:MAG TPA: hypothetical protein VEJ63_10255 [Planctomycetota bacterium]|nr:hypothetical protein [Planctomycetota bacterium]
MAKAVYTRGAIALIIGVMLAAATSNTPIDYVVPEHLMKERIESGRVMPEPRVYRTGVPFGGIRMEENWSLDPVRCSRNMVSISYSIFAANLVFWVAAVLVAFWIGYRLSRFSSSNSADVTVN